MGVAIFNQGLILAYYAHENCLETERDAIITNINNKLNSSIVPLIDTATWASLVAEIGYDAVADRIYAHVQATPTS